MATFSENVLQSYYDTRNYTAAADYLASFVAKDPQSQREVNAQIRKLRRDAAVQNSMLSELSQEEREAFNFMQGMNDNGTIPRNRVIVYNKGQNNEYHVKEQNNYGTQYLNYINNLKTNDGKNIDRIGVKVKSQDDLQQICSLLGYDDIKANDIGIKQQALNDGSYYLYTEKNNKNLYKLLNAAHDLSTRSVGSIIGNISTRMLQGAGVGAAIGAPFAGVTAAPGALIGGGTGLVTATIEEIYNKIKNDAKFDIVGIDEGGKVYSKDDYNYDDLKKAVDTVNDANELYEKIKNKEDEEEQEHTSETEVSQFLGLGHMEAYEALRNNKIDQTTFDKIQKNWEEYYDRLMINSDFTKHKVYAWSAKSKEGVNLTAVENKEIPDLKGEVLVALKDGRCSYALATRDGVLGTMITIQPKNDGKEGWSEAKGEVQKQIFVEGLFDEKSANAVFERDTKTIAARQNADMKKHHYELSTATGATVGYDKDGKSYVKVIDDNGDFVKQYVDESYILHKLNEDNIINNSVSEVLANMTPEGTLYERTVDGKKVQPTIEDVLQIFAAAGTNELYPKGSMPEVQRAAYQNKLYLSMYNDVHRYLYRRKNN